MNNVDESPYLLVMNKNQVIDIEQYNAIIIPVMSHGLNKFSNYTKIAFIPALNRKPSNIGNLEAFGITKEFQLRERTHSIAYQGIMRTAARNLGKNSNTKIEVIVADKATADFLGTLFDNCEIGLINGGYTKNVIKSNTEEYKHLQYVKKNLNELNTKLKKEYELDTSISIFKDLYDKSPESFVDTKINVKKLLLKCFNNQVVQNKENVYLINSNLYKEKDNRLNSNIELSSLLFIDIDDGDLTKENLLRILKKYKLSSLVFNSFSSTKENNRMRVVLNLSQAVTSELYSYCFDWFISLLAKEGYSSVSKQKMKELEDTNIKFSGVDLSKRHAGSIFYTPCKQQGLEDNAFFFEQYWSRETECQKYTINIDNILQLYQADINKKELKENNSIETISYRKETDIIKRLKDSDIYLDDWHRGIGLLAACMSYNGYTETDFLNIIPYVTKNRDKIKTYENSKKTWKDWTNRGYNISLGYVVNLIQNN